MCKYTTDRSVCFKNCRKILPLPGDSNTNNKSTYNYIKGIVIQESEKDYSLYFIFTVS